MFLRRQLLRPFCDSIDLVGCPAAEGRVRAQPIVIVNPGTDAAARFAARLEGGEQDALIFKAAPEPLNEDQRPRPSIEMRMPASLSVVVKAKLVNCEP